MQLIKVALVENMPLLHDVYSQVLHHLEGIELVAAFFYPEDLIAQLDVGMVIDAVVMDIRMDEDSGDDKCMHMDGIEAACQIRARWPKFPVVFCSYWDNPDYYRRIEAARFRTHYAILKRDSLEVKQLGQILHNVTRGFTYFDEVVRIEMEQVQLSDDQAVSRLLETDDQLKVLTLMSDGLSNEGIARALNMRERTIQEIIRQIYEVFDLQTENVGDSRRVRAVRMFIEQRVLTWEEGPDGIVRIMAQAANGNWRLLDEIKQEAKEQREKAIIEKFKASTRTQEEKT